MSVYYCGVILSVVAKRRKSVPVNPCLLCSDVSFEPSKVQVK
jgi:hypothetical protein